MASAAGAGLGDVDACKESNVGNYLLCIPIQNRYNKVHDISVSDRIVDTYQLPFFCTPS